MISVRINCSRINKARLFQGKNGKYLDLILMEKREPDQYGNDWMVCESVSKEEREAGVKGEILGSGKTLKAKPKPEAPKPANAPMTPEDQDDVPF
jgi:hypothetical protein